MKVFYELVHHIICLFYATVEHTNCVSEVLYDITYVTSLLFGLMMMTLLIRENLGNREVVVVQTFLGGIQ